MKRLSNETLHTLRAHGLIRVDGLLVLNWHGRAIYTVLPPHPEIDAYETNNSMGVISLAGQLWWGNVLAVYPAARELKILPARDHRIGISVPLSNGEGTFDPSQLADRQLPKELQGLVR